MGKSKKQNHTIVEHITNTKVQLAITIVSTIFLIINALITSQLAPIARDIKEISRQVDAIEKDYTPRSDFEINLENFNSRLDRIESNQDLILQRLN